MVNYLGGVYQNNISEKICPDLIVSKKETDRYTYIHNMKIRISALGQWDWMNQ